RPAQILEAHPAWPLNPVRAALLDEAHHGGDVAVFADQLVACGLNGVASDQVLARIAGDARDVRSVGSFDVDDLRVEAGKIAAPSRRVFQDGPLKVELAPIQWTPNMRISRLREGV